MPAQIEYLPRCECNRKPRLRPDNITVECHTCLKAYDPRVIWYDYNVSVAKYEKRMDL